MSRERGMHIIKVQSRRREMGRFGREWINMC
jgi:hypothetical protein